MWASAVDGFRKWRFISIRVRTRGLAYRTDFAYCQLSPSCGSYPGSSGGLLP